MKYSYREFAIQYPQLGLKHTVPYKNRDKTASLSGELMG